MAVPPKSTPSMRDKVIPAMGELRELGDQIEVLTPHEIWPLPTAGNAVRQVVGGRQWAVGQ